MNEAKYKLGFGIALVVCFALAGTLAYVTWGGEHPAPEEMSVVAARGA